MWYLFSKITDRHVARCLTAAVLLCICGCGDFFAHKPTEIQTKIILKDLKQIEENPNVKNPLPELYRQPPEKLEVDDGVKVFYFCKNFRFNFLKVSFSDILLCLFLRLYNS